MGGKLERYMVCSGRALCQSKEYRAALFEPPILIGLTDHAMSARFVHARVKCEFAAVVGGLARRHDAPAGDDLGEIRDIVLRIARSHAKRMQLENLACEIFVKSLVTTQACE